MAELTGVCAALCGGASRAVHTPSAAMRAYDVLMQAESGICAVTGTPEEPSEVGVSAADIATGMNAHAAILEALIARGRSGRGAQIEIVMFDGMADWMAVPCCIMNMPGAKPHVLACRTPPSTPTALLVATMAL